MTLISFGALYLGIDAADFVDIWCMDGALTVHLGRLRLELSSRSRRNGSTQTTNHRPQDG